MALPVMSCHSIPSLPWSCPVIAILRACLAFYCFLSLPGVVRSVRVLTCFPALPFQSLSCYCQSSFFSVLPCPAVPFPSLPCVAHNLCECPWHVLACHYVSCNCLALVLTLPVLYVSCDSHGLPPISCHGLPFFTLALSCPTCRHCMFMSCPCPVYFVPCLLFPAIECLYWLFGLSMSNPCLTPLSCHCIACVFMLTGCPSLHRVPVPALRCPAPP